MAGIIVQKTYGSHWKRLVRSGQSARVVQHIRDVVDDSYLIHPMRRYVASEDERRRLLCADYLEAMVFQQGWSLQRGLDEMARHLWMALDQDRSWEPSKRKMWAAPDQDIL